MDVVMLSHTTKPLHVIAAAKGLMRGVTKMPGEILDIDAEEEFRDCLKTEIKGPFEFIDFAFVISGVTRAFTHQLVRHRVGTSFVQESMRFSVKSGKQFAYAVPESVVKERMVFSEKDGIEIPVEEIYHNAMEGIQQDYENLLNSGIPPEDARGILPTNILTSIAFKCNYRALYEMANQRMCMQTQKEFRDVMLRIRSCVSDIHGLLGASLTAICEKQKFCPWGSKLDRECPLQEKYPVRIPWSDSPPNPGKSKKREDWW